MLLLRAGNPTVWEAYIGLPRPPWPSEVKNIIVTNKIEKREEI